MKQYAFTMICGSGRSKSRLAEANENVEKLTVSDHSWKLACGKIGRGAVARSAFASQKVKSMKGSGHFWKFGCQKIAHCCGPKHISKSKLCTKHQRFGTLLEVRMSKKCPTDEIDRSIVSYFN